jgi:exosortase
MAPTSFETAEHLLEKEIRAGSFLRVQAVSLCLCAAAFLFLFWPTLASLVAFWVEDPDFSHGFLIPVVSGAILFTNRESLAGMKAERALTGLAVFLISLFLFFIGYLSLTNIFQRLGVWGALAGAVWFLFGTASVRAVSFPLLFLLAAIPPPFVILTPIRLALKGIATRLSADTLSILGQSAVPEGNVLALGEHRLEVADACSGIRSLMAIVSTAVLFAYLFKTGLVKGILLTLIAIPITVVINVLRVVVIAFALGKFDVDLTSGAAHELIGLAVFSLSLVLIYFCWRFCEWFSGWKPSGRTA